MKELRVECTVTVDRRGRTHIAIPVDPDSIWGIRARHHVTGSINTVGVRGILVAAVGGSGWELVLGPAWCPSAFTTGDVVKVVLRPEGPQLADLAPDLASAFDEDPAAAAFFADLAQFYRKQYLTWINATKRDPSQRPVRIAELMTLLDQGHKERPK